MLIRFPEAWPHWFAALVAMILLAGLDLGGAYAAKEAVERRSIGHAALGVALFVVLFWVFASSLQYADLTPVTVGWIVVLQVGVILLDRYRYGVDMPRGHWVAIAIIIAAQAYLLVGLPGAPTLPGSDGAGEATNQVQEG